MIKKMSMFQTTYKDKNELFAHVGYYLEAEGIVSEGFGEALALREQDYPTGLPTEPAVAIPHTDGTLVMEDTILCVLNLDPIEFNEMGGLEDDVIYPQVFFILALTNGDTHLEELQKLIGKIQEGQLVDNVIAAKTKVELSRVVNQYL